MTPNEQNNPQTNTNNNPNSLPEGWKWVKLGEVVKINPKIPKEKIVSDTMLVQFLPMKLVEELSGKIHLTETRIYQEVRKGYSAFIENDILFAKVTPCMENGKIAVVTKLKNKIGFGSTEFHVLRTIPNVINKYIFYFIVQDKFRKLAEYSMTGAVGLRRVPKQFIEQQLLPLPPLPIQAAIVLKLEALFSELDKGIANLKTAQAQLKLYKQAVLKWAFEGKLTNPQLAQQTDNPNTLPEGWKWVKVMDIGRIETGSTPSKANPNFYSSDFPFYKPTDLSAGNVWKASDNLSKEGIKQARFLPENSILVTCIGATIGKTGIIRRAGACNQQINAIIPTKEHNPNFVYYQVIAPKFQEAIKNNASATTLPILNKSKFQNLSMVIPPLSEQAAIVSAIESRLSICDHITATIEQSLASAEVLRQSILKQAFAGKLI